MKNCWKILEIEGILKGKEKRDRIADHEQLMQIAEHIRQFYDIP